jgi:hypothetical protein
MLQQAKWTLRKGREEFWGEDGPVARTGGSEGDADAGAEESSSL